jgi:hypothetical protein
LAFIKSDYQCLRRWTLAFIINILFRNYKWKKPPYLINHVSDLQTILFFCSPEQRTIQLQAYALYTQTIITNVDMFKCLTFFSINAFLYLNLDWECNYNWCHFLILSHY